MPADVLYGLVDSLFYWDGLPAVPRERTFPNGRASLYVQLDDPYRPGEGASRDPYPSICVDGLLTGPLVVLAPPRRARVIGVKLTATGAVRILDTGLGALASATHDLEDVLGKSGRHFGARAAAAPSARAAIAVAIAWLRERVTGSRDLSPNVVWLAEAIESANGVLSTSTLMEACTSSPSRLRAAFRNHFGLSPKRFARIVRFRRSLELLASQASPLCEIAAVAGYYDQAHFNAEFKLHAGMTPSAFLSARRYPNSSSLAEA